MALVITSLSLWFNFCRRPLTWLHTPLGPHKQVLLQDPPQEPLPQGTVQSEPVQPGLHWQPPAFSHLHCPFMGLQNAPLTQEHAIVQFLPQYPWLQVLSQSRPEEPLPQMQDPMIRRTKVRGTESILKQSKLPIKTKWTYIQGCG